MLCAWWSLGHWVEQYIVDQKTIRKPKYDYNIYNEAMHVSLLGCCLSLIVDSFEALVFP
jgi:hypothetical protein